MTAPQQPSAPIAIELVRYCVSDRPSMANPQSQIVWPGPYLVVDGSLEECIDQF